MIRVLSLDTSTHVGWAHCDRLDENKPVFGTLNLPGWSRSGVGQSYVKLARFIRATIQRESLTHVIVERPLTVFAHAGTAAKHPDLAQALMGFTAVAELAALEVGAKCYVETSQTIRKHFLGNGRPKDPKAVVIARCRQLGWKPLDDNQADAIAGWDYAKSILQAKSLFDGTREIPLSRQT